MVKVNRFDVYLIDLDPAVGSEIRKTRPCVIVSPNEINHNLNTAIVAPLTTILKDYPSRISLRFQSKNGQVALDQIRTVDQIRFIKKLGTVGTSTAKKISGVLVEIFQWE